MNKKNILQTIKKCIKEAMKRSTLNENPNFEYRWDDTEVDNDEKTKAFINPTINADIPSSDSRTVEQATFLSEYPKMLDLIEKALKSSGVNIGNSIRRTFDGTPNMHGLDVYQVPMNLLRPIVRNVSPLNLKMQLRTELKSHYIKLHGTPESQSRWIQQVQTMGNAQSMGKDPFADVNQAIPNSFVNDPDKTRAVRPQVPQGGGVKIDDIFSDPAKQMPGQGTQTQAPQGNEMRIDDIFGHSKPDPFAAKAKKAFR